MFKQLIILILLSINMAGCHVMPIDTDISGSFLSTTSNSKKIPLKIRDSSNGSFCFVLKHSSLDNDYKLHVRWHNNQKGDILFNDYQTRMTILLDKTKLLTFHPIKRPKIVSYNVNNNAHIEEAIFSLSLEEMRMITFSRSATVTLFGRRNIIVGQFSDRNTYKAFKDFFNKSY